MRASILILSAAIVLSGCGGSGDDKLADRVESSAENRADALEDRADALEDRADAVRDGGERRADAIDAADINASAMTQEQRDAMVANEAAAVR